MLHNIARGIGSLLNAIVLVIMLPVVSLERKCRYGKEDISFGKFYKAATNTNRRLLKDLFLIIFYRTHVALVESWPSTVEDYCFDLLCWSRRKYRDTFNSEERKLLNTPVESLEGDVSLMYKLILKLFENINLPTTFLNVLRDAKSVRNRVCHEELDFTDEMLQSNMEDLKQIFEKLFNEMKDTLSVDVSGLQKFYCDEVDEIMAAPITGEGTSYFEKMEKFRDDLIGKFITHGRKELILFYSRLSILNPFTWLSDDKFSELQVDKIFTPLHISYVNLMIDVESLLITESIDENTLEKSGILPSVLILTGIAGCGKTSLCRYLLYDWRTRLGAVTNMRSVDILILIEARNLTTNSLVSYLQRTLLKETCIHFEEKDILPTLQKLNVLYVVDGMDEATEDGRQLLNELFSVLGSSRVILTTRPEFTSSIVSPIISHHLTFIKLQIHGFSERGISKFTSRVFRSLESNEQKRSQQEIECLRFLMTTGKRLGNNLKIPLTLALLIILWRDDKSSLTKVTSVTRLYSEIFSMCTTKMLSRIKKATPSTCLDLDTFLEEWLLELGKMAYAMIKKNEYVISNTDRKLLTAVCKKYSMDTIQILSSFLICEVQESLGGVQYLFSFIHKSQMEYFAGYYYAHILIYDYNKENNTALAMTTSRLKAFELLDKSGERSCQEIVEMRKVFRKLREPSFQQIFNIKMLNVYMFTIGHLCICNDIITELVTNIADYLLSYIGHLKMISALWRLVQESDCHPVVCNMVGDVVPSNFIWKPEGEELCDPMDPTLQLFKYTNFKPKGLMIRIVDSIQDMKIMGDEDEIEKKPYTNLIPILQAITKHPEVDVVLRVDQHYYNWGDQETTDHLLMILTPNSNLTGFMGHLGVRGAKAFMELPEVHLINVRISDVETLHAFSESVAAMTRNPYLQMTIRLDISRTVSPSSLPTFTKQFPFHIILKDIGDESVSWACEILVQLSNVYNEIELVSSSLTGDGGRKFFETLGEKQVVVKEKVSIRSCHSVDKEAFQALEKMINCKLEWW